MFQCLIGAGRFHKTGKKQLTTMKESLIPAGLYIEEMILPLNTKDWEVDTRSIVNPTTRGRSICHRPAVPVGWKLSFTLNIDPMFSTDLIRDVVDDAGKKLGLLDYSPRHRGPFGRFKVVHWEVLEEEEVPELAQAAE